MGDTVEDGDILNNNSNDNEETGSYKALISYGINKRVADELEKFYKEGLLRHEDLDSRALDALKEFNADTGVAVLKEFKESNLIHVSNKSAFLCGVMKTFRQKNKFGDSSPTFKKGPDEEKIKEILDRTGYTLDVTTGQRKYGGPPPTWEGEQPGMGHEVFCGKIPKDIFEDELIPLFEQAGSIWDLRLMMDPMSGLNRSFCFVTYTEKDAAQRAVEMLNGYEIRPGKQPLKVNVSVANLRLFVGNIPKNKSKEDIMTEFKKITDCLIDAIIYSSPDDPQKKNRGFAFLEYDSHKSASLAKRKLSTARVKVWGCDVIVDWADPILEPDDETMSKVKVLYIRNLRSDIKEDALKAKFEPYGKIEHVKKLKDYGFVHFEERECAMKAMEDLNGQKLNDSVMEISLAKPPSESRQRQKQKRDEAKRHMMMMYGGYDDFYMPMPPMFPPPGIGRGRMFRPPLISRGGFHRGGNYDPEFYSGNFNDHGGRQDFIDESFSTFDEYYTAPESFGNHRGRSRPGPPLPSAPAPWQRGSQWRARGRRDAPWYGWH